MKVSYINIETAIQKMEEIHQNVDPLDKSEKELYEQIVEIGELLVDAYNAAGVPKKEMEKELKYLLDVYFEKADNFKMREK